MSRNNNYPSGDLFHSGSGYLGGQIGWVNKFNDTDESDEVCSLSNSRWDEASLLSGSFYYDHVNVCHPLVLDESDRTSTRNPVSVLDSRPWLNSDILTPTATDAATTPDLISLSARDITDVKAMPENSEKTESKEINANLDGFTKTTALLPSQTTACDEKAPQLWRSISELEDKIEQLFKKDADRDEMIAQRDNTISMRDNKITVFLDKTAAHDKQVSDLKNTILHRDKEIVQLRMSLMKDDHNATESSQNLCKAHDEKIKYLGKQLDGGDEEIAQLTRNVVDSDQDATELLKQLCEALVQKIEYLKHQLGERDEKITRLTARVTEGDRRVAELNNEVADLGGKIAERDEVIETWDTQATQILKKIALLDKKSAVGPEESCQLLMDFTRRDQKFARVDKE